MQVCLKSFVIWYSPTFV